MVAPRAQATGDQFLQAATLTNANGVDGDLTGFSVAISADGSTMVVGVPDANGGQGLAYVYTRGANGWQTANQPAVLAASNGAAGDEFGHSVAVSQDGSVIAVGAPYAGGGGSESRQVYVFNRPAAGWAPQTTLNQTTSASGPADYDRLGHGSPCRRTAPTWRRARAGTRPRVRSPARAACTSGATAAAR